MYNVVTAFLSSKLDSISVLLHQLRLLKTLETVQYKLAVLTFKHLHQTSSSNLDNHKFLWCLDVEARRRLHSVSSSSLIVRRTRLSTVGDRAFAVPAAPTIPSPRVWNELVYPATSRLHHPSEFSALI